MDSGNAYGVRPVGELHGELAAEQRHAELAQAQALLLEKREGDDPDYPAVIKGDKAIITRRIEAVAGVATSPRVLPGPTQPMVVARQIVDDLFTTDGALVLRLRSADFHRWDGRRWPEVEAAAVRAEVYRYLEHAVFDGKHGPEDWNPNRRKVEDVLDALRAIVHLDAATEAPAWLHETRHLPPAAEMIAVGNGLLHIPSRQLLPHRPGFWTHHALPFDFDPDAPAPTRWLTFLKELWEDASDNSISVLQEVIGYLIGGDTRQQKIVLVVGPKRSGKGTMGRVMTGLLGRHNVAAPTLAGLATNFGLQPLIGRPLALVSDARLSTKADASIVVERLLSVSGEDSITIDRKYRAPWTGRLPSRFVILTNELPRLADSSGALSSRFIILVLTKTFYGREDPELTDRLLTEAPSILNWALAGYDRLIQRGRFEQATSGAEALRQLEDLASPVAAFIRDRCHLDAIASVPHDELWTAWKEWCGADNRHPGTKALFGRDLRAAVPTLRDSRPRDGEERRRIYAGISLRPAKSRPDLGPPGPPLPEQADEPSGPGGPRTAPMHRSHDAGVPTPREPDEIATTSWCRDFVAHQTDHRQIAGGVWWCDLCQIGMVMPA